MGAVFALGSTATALNPAHPQAVATGMRATFAVAAVLNIVALAISLASRARVQPCVPSGGGQEEGPGA
ncbi:hypothetical protein D9M68_992010 [compost metagenome]